MSLILPKFEYYKPSTLDEALELLAKFKGDARILAGGTDLIVDLRSRIKKPKAVIDIKGIKELHKLEYIEGKGLIVGATVTLNELLEHPIVKSKFHVLYDSVRQLADMQLRNRATLVGNICNASPAADSAPALLVLDAKVKAVSKRGERVIEIKDFFKWVKKTALEPDEMVTEVFIPEPPEGSRGKYYKATRNVEDLAIVGVAGLVAHPNEPSKRIVRLAYASVAPTPIRIYEVEELFKRDEPLPKLIDEAVNIALRKVSPITDVRGSDWYRRHLVDVLTRKLLIELFLEG